MKYPIRQIGIKHLDWVSLALETELPAYSKMIVMYLARFMNRDQDMAWPSLRRMESELGVRRATICKYIELLESEGWLTRERGSKGKNTRYFVSFPKKIEEVVHQMNHLPAEVVHQMNHGGSPDEPGVVHHTDTNSQLNNKYNTSIVRQRPNYTEQVTEVIDFLNTKTGKSFEAKSPNGDLTANGKLILNLLKKGYTTDDIRMVTARKYREWSQKADMIEFLRPKTLFAPSNFENYIGECV